ncbi:DUF2794 domain-containing protein [Alphaproteobacteria bacterium HT1-32]|nr:DUF2794 domain-containing protein [Alphaproteobacteria bacterium HT1-32]
MSNLVNLRDHRRRQPVVRFDRAELMRLLQMYSQRVARGEWRDYAIDMGPGAATFSVFRSTHETPLFAISKVGGANARNGKYKVFCGPRILKQGADLGEVLKVFEAKLIKLKR